MKSLRARITFLTLALFVVGIWSLAAYINITLRADLEQALGEQQYATTRYVAADVNAELEQRKQALEVAAAAIGPATQGNAAAMQAYLEQRITLLGMFNGGLFATDTDGTAVADVPRSAGRIGTNYMDRTTVSIPLTEEKPLIGKPAMGKKLQKPIFSMAAPIRDQKGQVIGVLVGTVNLGLPNFLDHLVHQHYGKNGNYFLFAPQHKLIVTATDKHRVMQPIAPAGISPVLDAVVVKGYEGYLTGRNSSGVDVLASAKGIPVAGWILAASLPTAEAFAPIETLMARLFLGAAMLTLVASGLAWWITALFLRRQIAPILASTHAVRALASDLTKEVSPPLVPAGTSDEIGQLIDSFNQLTHSLVARQESLRASEERLRLAQESASVGIWDWDLVADKLVWTEELERLYGYSPGSFTGDYAAFASRVHADDIVAVEQHWKDAVAAHQPINFDFRILRPDGATRWVNCQGAATYDAAGQPLRVLGVNIDITERKRAEAQLRALAARLQNVREDERTVSGRPPHGLNQLECVKSSAAVATTN